MCWAISQAPFPPLSLAGDEKQRGYSWVPDFDRAHEPLIYRLNAVQNAFSASRDQLEHHESFDEFNDTRARILRFPGMMIDTVYQLAGPMPPRRACDKFNVSSDNSFFFPEWYDWAEMKAMTKYRGEKQRYRNSCSI
jgi:hypothetical protein